MAEFARRSLTKVTYAPIRPSEEDQRSGVMERRQRGLEKAGFAGALRVQAREVDGARRMIQPPPAVGGRGAGPDGGTGGPRQGARGTPQDRQGLG